MNNPLLNWFTSRPLVIVGVVIVLVLGLVGGIDSCRSRRYDKERAKYEEESKAWATEKAELLGRIAERDKRIEHLEAKEAAIIAADQAGKKVDDALATKIDEVTKAAADEAVTSDQPTDCWVRADRTCAKLAGLKPPIRIDCNVYKRKLCGQ